MRVNSIHVVILILGLGLIRTQLVIAGEPPEAPLTSKTTDDIVKNIEPFKGPGEIQSVLFDRWGRRIFAAWYCPFSGRGDCYLHAYYYDFAAGEWVRFLNQVVETDGDLSIEMPTGNELLIRAAQGNVVSRQPLEGFPRKRP